MEKSYKKNNLIVNLLFNNSLFIVFLFFIFFKPAYFSTIPLFNNFINILMIIFSFLIVVIYLARKKFDSVVLLVILYYIILFISTLYNRGDIEYFLIHNIPIVVLMLYIDVLIDVNKDKFFKSFVNYFSIINIINFITVLFRQDRYNDRVYFLGYDNDFAPIIVLGCFILLLYHYQLKKEDKKSFWLNIMYIISIITGCLVRSATFKIGIIMFGFAYFLIFRKDILPKKIFNYKIFLIFSFVIFIAIVYFQVQEHFKYIIVDLLKRDLTFTGRTYIWELAKEFVNRNQLLGIGFWNMTVRYQNLGIYHAHSTYLNILLETGILGFTIYSTLLILLGKKIKKIPEKRIAQIISFAFFTYFVMTISEVYLEIHIFYVIMILVVAFCKERKNI